MRPVRRRTLAAVASIVITSSLSLPGADARQVDPDLSGAAMASDARAGSSQSGSSESLISMREIADARATVRAELTATYNDILRHNAEIEALDATRAVTGPSWGREHASYLALVDIRNQRERQFQSLEAQLAAIDVALEEVAPWAQYGIDFAVFPMNEVDEFVNSWGNARSGGRRHKGTDILAPYGTELYALEDGVIDRTSNSALGGLSLYLVGDSGSRYYYAHLSELGTFQSGDRVHAGDIVGYNGDSGNARGTPHLHFQWAPDGSTWRNPYPLLLALWEFERGEDGPPARVWS